MTRALEKAPGVARGLPEINDEAREAAATPLNSELGHQEMRWRQLLAKQLPADLTRATAPKRGDEFRFLFRCQGDDHRAIPERA